MREIERWRSFLKSPQILYRLLFLKRYQFDFDLMPVELHNMSWAQRANLLRYGLNLVYRRAEAWSWPIHMQVEPANYCNLKCPMCPTGLKVLRRPPESMEVALFERLLSEAGPRLLTLALYAWGEPLLHPRLGELLKTASKYNIATFVSTNGQNLDDGRIQDALMNYPPSYLIVAIDGITDKTHSLFRVGARLGPALAGVQKLAALKKSSGASLPVLHMRFLVTKDNQHEHGLVKQFAETCRFDFLSIRTLSTIDSPGARYGDYLPRAGQFRAYRYDAGKRVKRRDFVCMHAFSYPTVFSDGTVVSCEQDFDAQHPYGVIGKDRSFGEIWFSAEAARIRRIIRDSPSRYSFCLNCPFADRPVSSCSVEAHDLRRPVTQAR